MLKTFYDLLISFCDKNLVTKKSVVLIYYITLIEIINNFKGRFKKAYYEKFHWAKILVMIKLRDLENVGNNSSLEVVKDSSSSNITKSESLSKVISSILVT